MLQAENHFQLKFHYEALKSRKYVGIKLDIQAESYIEYFSYLSAIDLTLNLRNDLKIKIMMKSSTLDWNKDLNEGLAIKNG